MGQWKDLPYEILAQIVETLQFQKGPWCTANKQMYTIFQSLEYKTICTDTSNSDKTFNAIINSCFDPGQHFKEVTLNKFIAPNDLSTMNSVNDPLCQFIKRTPNVTVVSIIPAPQAKEWEYLSIALLEDVSWKLQKLP